MSLLVQLFEPVSVGFPRASGDEPHDVAQMALTTQFSPRERG